MLRAGLTVGLLSALALASCANPAPKQPEPTRGPVCRTKASPSELGAHQLAGRTLGDFDGAVEVEAWVDMWNRFDLDKVDVLFVRDARVTYFSSEKPGLIAGIDALREHHRGFGFVPGGADRGSRLWLEEVQAHTYGRVVLVTATWLFQRRGSDKAQRGPVTLVLLSEGSGCRITHAHFANDPAPKVAPPEPTR